MLVQKVHTPAATSGDHVVSGANRHDIKLLVPSLDAIVIPRPSPTTTGTQYLCADRGYSDQPAADAMKRRGYKLHVRQRGEEIAAKKRHSANGDRVGCFDGLA